MIAWDVWALRNNKVYDIVHSNIAIYDVDQSEWESFLQQVCQDTAGIKQPIKRITYAKEAHIVGIDF